MEEPKDTIFIDEESGDTNETDAIFTFRTVIISLVVSAIIVSGVVIVTLTLSGGAKKNLNVTMPLNSNSSSSVPVILKQSVVKSGPSNTEIMQPVKTRQVEVTSESELKTTNIVKPSNSNNENVENVENSVASERTEIKKENKKGKGPEGRRKSFLAEKTPDLMEAINKKRETLSTVDQESVAKAKEEHKKKNRSVRENNLELLKRKGEETLKRLEGKHQVVPAPVSVPISEAYANKIGKDIRLTNSGKFSETETGYKQYFIYELAEDGVYIKIDSKDNDEEATEDLGEDQESIVETLKALKANGVETHKVEKEHVNQDLVYHLHIISDQTPNPCYKVLKNLVNLFHEQYESGKSGNFKEKFEKTCTTVDESIKLPLAKLEGTTNILITRVIKPKIVKKNSSVSE